MQLHMHVSIVKIKKVMIVYLLLVLIKIQNG